MEVENKQKKNTGILIFIFILIGVIVLIYFVFGIHSLLQIVKWFFIILFSLAILGAVFYLVWYLFFKKHKFDVVYVNKMKLLDACKKGNPKVLKDLYISGDKGHSRVKWGHLKGYCRISVMYREPVMVQDEKTGLSVTKQELNEITKKMENVYTMRNEEQDVFSVSHANNFLTALFEEQDIVRVSPNDHDELVGDVTVFGFSLLPISEFWFLNNDYLDISKVDMAIWTEAKRGIMFEMLKDSKEIVDKASGLDSDHQKRIEEKSMYEVPVNNTSQAPPR